MKELAVIDFETTPIKDDNTVDKVLGYCIKTFEFETCYKWNGDDNDYNTLQKFCDDYILIAHNAAFELYVLQEKLGMKNVELQCTMLMSYLLEPDRELVTYMHNGKQHSSKHSLGSWGERLLFAKEDSPEFTEWSEDMAKYCLQDVRLTLEVYNKLAPLINEDKQLLQCYQRIEIPFLQSIVAMQKNGLRFDKEALEQFISKREARCAVLLEEMRQIVGQVPTISVKGFSERNTDEFYFVSADTVPDKRKSAEAGATRTEYTYKKWGEFNPSSGTQVAYALIKLYGWKPSVFTKTGKVDTSGDVLAALDFPLCELLTEYVHEKKLVDAYGTTVINYMDDTGRVYTSIKNCETVTGRLSTVRPAMQTAPSRGELGFEYRKCIIARDGYELVGADKSSFQMKIAAYFLATLINKPELRDKINDGLDVHTANAEICGITRPEAKTVGFGRIFGMEAELLAKNLKCGVDKAQELLQKLDEGTGVGDLADLVVAICEAQDGVLHDLYGRKFYYPLINSEERFEKLRAERQCFNALIQGTEASIMKMITEQARVAGVPYGALLCLQVHDEVIFEVPKENVDGFKAVLSKIFSNPGWLPGFVEQDESAKSGANWSEIH